MAQTISMKKTHKHYQQRNYSKIILVSIILSVAILLILYPFIANYIFEHRADGIIETVEQTTAKTNQAQFEEELEKAKQYNETLANGHIQLKDPFIEDSLKEDTAEYNSLLNMTEDGVMGFVKIPCINVSVPLYHGTSEDILQIGAGHLQGTSLPIGGMSTHSVITGHTGLSSAKIFTDLTELEQGDIFMLHVMGQKLAYQVDKISVVLPSEMDEIQITPGKDYCTLVTCTPYSVNTHRLLVRGSRIPYPEEAEKPEIFQKTKTESQWMEEYVKSIIISALCFIVLLVILLLWRYYNSNKKKKYNNRNKSRNKSKNKSNVKRKIKPQIK